MNKNNQTLFTYHEQTKHSSGRYAKSLGYMDWANQPNPYRYYLGAKQILLPLASEFSTPPYHLLFSNSLPSAPLLLQSISQFLQFSMGVTAIKSNGIDDWDLRCNASSGNLHPSESYVILPPMAGISEKTSLAHYLPKNHSLQVLCEFESPIWQNLPDGSFFTALSSIVYREVWKYGERAFRYSQLDVGHALRSLQISAKILGWHDSIITTVSNEELSIILGLNQKNRFSEDEIADLLLLITPHTFDANPNLYPLLKSIPNSLDSIAKNIAQEYQKWPIIEQIETATSTSILTPKTFFQNNIQKEPTLEAKYVIQNRRSAQMMNENNSLITYKQFFTLLNSTLENFTHLKNSISLIIFVHNVEDLESGLYLFVRELQLFEDLKNQLDKSFLFESINENLFALTYGDFKLLAKNISCSQNIAADGAFGIGMLSEFSDEIIQNGEHRYKELYWECGAIGQQLYLEATSLGLSATGIGCYLDDEFHKLLGLGNNKYQSLYHFTIGRALVDGRILSKKPYENRK